VLKVAAWRRGPMWLGVRLFGKSHWGSGSPLSSVDDPAVAAEEAADAP
jgi:hypothetical protein